MTTAPQSPVLSTRQRQTLHVIAFFEAIKGACAILAASGLGLLGPAPLQQAVHTVIQRFHLDPEHGALPALIGMIDPGAVHIAVIVLVLYALLRFVEAWGLWRMRAWASILGCLSAALYLPLDIYAVFHRPGLASCLILAINLIVVAVLWRDLTRRRHPNKSTP